MSYPEDKEYFRRVINRELPLIPGDTVDQEDQNKPADFLERLQDVLGYGVRMGFPTMKDFFDWINDTIAGVKKNNIIPLYQSVSPITLNTSTVTYYGGNLTLKDTDKLILQANIIWKTTTALSGSGYWNFARNFNLIGQYLRPETFKQNTHITSTYNYTIETPIAGTAAYEFRIDNRTQQIVVENINVFAIIISV